MHYSSGEGVRVCITPLVRVNVSITLMVRVRVCITLSHVEFGFALLSW